MTATGARAVVHLGPGGVGKTTVAAATAVAAARAGLSVAVLTIDPARRLADTLGLDAGGDEVRPVDGPWAGRLWAVQLDPAATLASVLHRDGAPGQADRVLANPTFQALTRSTPGLNEYMAVERLHQLCHDDRFDLIVVDTPPSRHAIDFLDSPQRLVSFLDNRLYRALLAPRGGMLRSVNTAAQAGLRSVSRLVGVDLVDQIVGLFADLDGLDRGVRRRAGEMRDLLHGPRCHYRIVTTARPDGVTEARWLGQRLDERGVGLDALVINRLTPHGRGRATTAGAGPGRAALQHNLDQLRALSRSEDELVNQLVSELGGPPAVRLAERAVPVRGLDDLLDLAADVEDAGATPGLRPGRPRPLRSTR